MTILQTDTKAHLSTLRDNFENLTLRDDIVVNAARIALDELPLDSEGLPKFTPNDVKQRIVDLTSEQFETANTLRSVKGRGSYSPPEGLVAAQIALILTRLHRVITIIPDEQRRGEDNGLLGVYQFEGGRKGTYATTTKALRAVAAQYAPAMDKRAWADVEVQLRDRAPEYPQFTSRDVVPMGNGLFDYSTGALSPFDPEHVVLHKAAVAMRKDATNVTYYRAHNPEGEGASHDIDVTEVAEYRAKGWLVTEWDFDSWLSDLFSGYDEPKAMETVVLQTIGAALRLYVSWSKAALYTSESGNNAKGTIIHMIRAMVGKSISLSLAQFSGFDLSALLEGGPILNDENDVGGYLSTTAALKATITNDRQYIDVKSRPGVSHRHFGFMIQCLNEKPKFRDRSNSLLRRFLVIPFKKSFTGRELSYIKNEYLVREEVLEYVAKRVLLELPEYYQLSIPAECAAALDDLAENNDPVRQFWNELEQLFVWDFLPFTFLYDVYKAWLPANNPKGSQLGKNIFMTELRQVVEGSELWVCRGPKHRSRPGSMMDAPEPLIEHYRLEGWMANGYGDPDLARRHGKPLAQNYTGLVRRDGAPSASALRAEYGGSGVDSRGMLTLPDLASPPVRYSH